MLHNSNNCKEFTSNYDTTSAAKTTYADREHMH